MTATRIIVTFVGALAALTGAWWLVSACMLVLCMRWLSLEAVLIGILFDFAWSAGHIGASWHTWPLFTLLSIVLLWAFSPLRQRFLY